MTSTSEARPGAAERGWAWLALAALVTGAAGLLTRFELVTGIGMQDGTQVRCMVVMLGVAVVTLVLVEQGDTRAGLPVLVAAAVSGWPVLFDDSPEVTTWLGAATLAGGLVLGLIGVVTRLALAGVGARGRAVALVALTGAGMLAWSLLALLPMRTCGWIVAGALTVAALVAPSLPTDLCPQVLRAVTNWRSVVAAILGIELGVICSIWSFTGTSATVAGAAGVVLAGALVAVVAHPIARAVAGATALAGLALMVLLATPGADAPISYALIVGLSLLAWLWLIDVTGSRIDLVLVAGGILIGRALIGQVCWPIDEPWRIELAQSILRSALPVLAIVAVGAWILARALRWLVRRRSDS